MANDREVGKYSLEDYQNRFGEGIKRLIPYLSWLEQHIDQDVFQNYRNQMDRTMSFPVFDGTLLSFVKDAQATGMMDRNYLYVYSRRGFQTPEDELKFIERARLQDMDDLNGILSKYVLQGNTRAAAWSEGVSTGIFFHVVKKMDEILKTWGKKATDIR